jgi:hypothetical protein
LFPTRIIGTYINNDAGRDYIFVVDFEDPLNPVSFNSFNALNVVYIVY